jgi:hypothetical protein
MSEIRSHLLRAMICAVLSLTSCSLSGVVGNDISDYQTAAGESGNRQLLVNVLRARDEEPLHFSQLTQIHGSAMLSGSLSATIPFGPNSRIAPENVGLSAMYSQNPSFDIGTLDDQTFWLGITTRPISPEDIAGLIRNSGIDPRIAFLLFFSEIDIPGQKPRVNNSTFYEYANHPATDTPRFRENWRGYIGFIDEKSEKGRALTVHLYRELQPLGMTSKVPPSAKDLPSTDTSKFIVRPIGAMFQLYSVTDRYAFCVKEPSGEERLIGFPITASPIYKYIDDQYDNICSRSEAVLDRALIPTEYPLFRIRSVYGIFEYLGMILRFQERWRSEGYCITVNRPVPNDPAGRCSQDVLFQVNPPGETSKVVARFGNADYAVSNYAECLPTHCDHSLQVLSILGLLLNLNKKLQDVPQTPTVRTIP